MRLLALLICIPILMGNTSTLNIHLRTMDFIKKNEGTVYHTYPDDNPRTKRIEYAGCWGSHFDVNDRRFKHKRYFSHDECEKIIYKHYFKRVVPRIPKHITGNKYIAYADTVYQWHRFSMERLKQYPERGRWAMYTKQQKVHNTK